MAFPADLRRHGCRLRFFVVVAAAFVVWPAAVWGLDPGKSVFHFNCQSWTREAGLPANKITAITQTSDGMVWLGSQNGLVRFDGLEFTSVPIVLGHVENQEVRALARSVKGGLWFATNNGGFGYFDGRDFSSIPDPRWHQPTVISTTIFETRNGVLWTGSQPGWGRWLPGKPDETFIEGLISDETTLILAEDTSGRIWRGTAARGLYFYSNGKWTELADPYLKKHNIFSLCGDAAGNIWVGTELGIRCYDVKGELKETPPLAGDIKAILMDSHGLLWAGTNGNGLARLKDGVWTFLKKEDGLVSDFVTSLYEDTEGSLWVGTRDGLSQVTDLKFPILSVRDGFPEGSSHSVVPSRDGGLWVLSYGLYHFDGKSPQNYTEALTSMNQYLINGLETRNGDLYLIDGDKCLVRYTKGKIDWRLPSTTWPRSFAEGADGVYVGMGDTLCRIVDGKLQPYEFRGTKAELYWINHLSLAKDGAIWVGGNNGVFRLKDGTFQHWSAADGLAGDRVNWVSEDIDGATWVGATTGLSRIKDGKAVRITQENGLFDNRVYSIIPDDLGYFWISSGRGVFRVGRQQLNDFADGKLRSVVCDAYDGMESVKFADRTDQESSGCKTSDGRIWFPNPHGVVMIDPKNFYQNRIPPPVHIVTMEVDGVEVKDRGNLRLTPGDRRVMFNFTALSYIAPKKVKVRYQLKGADHDWIDAGQRRTVNYTHLRPGSYEFHVQACNADGVWNTEGASIAFVQPPRFFETGWFIVLCSCAGMAALAGGYRWKVRHMRAQQTKLQAENDLLEAKVAARTAELAREHALLRALLDNSPDQIYFKDAQSKYLKASRALADAFAVKSPEELIGKSDFDFFSEEHARPAYEDEQSIMRTGTPIIGKVEREVRTNGQVSWVLTSKMPLRNSANEIVGTFGSSKNITAIKEAEEKLEQVHKELLETSRRAGMAEVATSVLHNVGNVLNSVNVSATVVTDQLRRSKIVGVAKVSAMLSDNEGRLAEFITQDPRGQRLPVYLRSLSEELVSEQRRALEELGSLCKNVEHIKDIVATQQSFAKVSGVTETLPVVELIDDALRMYETALEVRDVGVVREYTTRPTITVEKHKVLQILVNLLKNAKGACDDAGRQDKTITIGIAESAGRIKISIRDNGIGIAPENLTRIFAHGFTTREQGHGFGLHSGALAAKELGGSLTAQSDGPGLGATFVLELPIKPQAPNARAA